MLTGQLTSSADVHRTAESSLTWTFEGALQAIPSTRRSLWRAVVRKFPAPFGVCTSTASDKRPPGPVTYWGENDRKRTINPTTKSRDKTLIIGG
eukprot:2365036-Pyramimonas_sp.AAC.1